MQDREIARSITESFLAAKIIKAIESTIARKESILIDDNNISLEDYLFADDNIQENTVDKAIFKNVKFVNSEGKILNISGSLFVTENEVLTLANGVTVRAPSVNIESTNEVASSFVTMPTSVDIMKPLSDVKDITIEKVGNTFNVVDTQTQEIIATVKTSIVPALKDFAASIIAAIKSIFGSIVDDPLPYAIGLLGGVIVFPVLKKVIGLFRSRKQNNQDNQNTNEENYFMDELNDVVFEEEDNSRLRKLFDRILMVLKTIYKKAVVFIKAVVGFMIGIFRKAKDVAQRSLVAIKRMFVTSSYKFIQYILYVVEVIVRYIKLAAARIRVVSSAIYTKTKKKVKEIVKTLYNISQKAIQTIKKEFFVKEEDLDLQKYLDAIVTDMEKLSNNLKTVISKDLSPDEEDRVLAETAKAIEDIIKHIFELLLAFLKKLKNKTKEIVQKLIDRTVRLLRILEDVFYSFVKALGEFARRIKAKITEWIDKIKNAISANPIYQKISQQLSAIKERIR